MTVDSLNDSRYLPGPRLARPGNNTRAIEGILQPKTCHLGQTPVRQRHDPTSPLHYSRQPFPIRHETPLPTWQPTLISEQTIFRLEQSEYGSGQPAHGLEQPFQRITATCTKTGPTFVRTRATCTKTGPTFAEDGAVVEMDRAGQRVGKPGHHMGRDGRCLELARGRRREVLPHGHRPACFQTSFPIRAIRVICGPFFVSFVSLWLNPPPRLPFLRALRG